MTYNRTEREAFACLAKLGPATADQLLDCGGVTTLSPITIRRALKMLVAGKLARRIPGPWRAPGHWELLPGAVMPPGKLRALPGLASVQDLPPRIIIRQDGTVPPELLERVTLAGLVAQMTGAT